MTRPLEVKPLGDRAVRLARPRSSARALVRAIRAWPGVIDVVVTELHVAVYFDGAPRVPEVMLDDLPDDPADARDIELRAVYDGPDLDAAARALGLGAEEIARIHRSREYTVELMGFSPGFAYLTELDPRLRLPRKGTPRPRVPAGSLAIAERYTAVYPFDSPGGWWLLGRVEGAVFGRLHLGDRVRFA